MAFTHTFLTKEGPVTKTLSAGKAIRQKCLECCCWSAHEVRMCTASDCALFPFRLGKSGRVYTGDPKKAAERLRKWRESQNNKRTEAIPDFLKANP